ncbi:HpcH/HpaI aldolase family protein [Govanella unica]|uniref:Aldolase/citrate lyase family protein n=1 Tax=Govanella unica TaxID=2975056 RepID=A0A9X3U0C8_9PROT|nr:aldolase/citrate lyase family protein [Govania unica]MDA5195025.1 aldolase/citrate lyase family protein [Govania unica]
MYRPNTLKTRLLKGEKAIASWLLLNSPDIAEVLAHAGFDALVMDHEHSTQTYDSAVAAMRAAAASSVTMLLRVPDNDHIYLKRALDAGAEGIMVPMVDSAEEAEAFVAACHYPPDGFRGVSFPTIRASGYGYQAGEYLKSYKDNLLLIAQVETAEAINNISKIAAVDGLDMVFIGIGDLSASIGKLGQFEDKKLLSMMQKAERAILKKKKLLGGIAFHEEMASAMFKRGYHFVVVTSDLSLLRDNAQRMAGALRKKI